MRKIHYSLTVRFLVIQCGYWYNIVMSFMPVGIDGPLDIDHILLCS